MVKANVVLYCYTDTDNEIKLNNTLMPMEQNLPLEFECLYQMMWI